MKTLNNFMNKELRIKQTEEQKVYFSSDFHLNHSPKWPIPIWKGRGFESVTEMNDAIIKSINDVVRSTDILIFLGDFVLNCSDSQFEEFLSRINCQNIYMLFGNHNSQVKDAYSKAVNEYLQSIYGDKHYQHSEDVEIYPVRYRNIIFVGNYLELIVDGQYFMASHYPQSSWNHMAKNSIHLHGHIHSTKETYIQNGKMIDVGFDYHRRPISVDEIKNLMRNVVVKHEGHH